MLKNRAAIQRNVDRLEEWDKRDTMEFNNGKCKALPWAGRDTAAIQASPAWPEAGKFLRPDGRAWREASSGLRPPRPLHLGWLRTGA